MRQFLPSVIISVVIFLGMWGLFYLRFDIDVENYNHSVSVSSSTTSKEEKLKSLFSGETLTRIGNELSFDYSTCPKHSVMLNPAKLNAKPLHDTCPQVFIIGARKGGTTSLYQYVSKHPDFEGVLLDKGPSAGETFYFSLHYPKNWMNYISQFPINKTSGDASVANLVDCMVPERIYRCCGRRVKVIVLLRHPLERYESNFRMRARLHSVHANSKLSTLLTKEIHQLHDLFDKNEVDRIDPISNINSLLCLFSPAKNCIFEALYYIHLHNWLCNFPAENIQILNSEEFFKSPTHVFSQVLDFVNLKPLDDSLLIEITGVKYNSGGRKEDEADYRLLSLSEKKALQAIYEPFSNELFKLLRWPNVTWSS